MKHHLRNESKCLNCGHEVEERFCTHCGQENTEPKESVGHLIKHFFEDITHYDSKFFITLKDLLFKPGFLTREYVSGKRIRYLNPIRMYIFISLIFFIVLFLKKEEHHENASTDEDKEQIHKAQKHIADSLRLAASRTKVNNATDSLRAKVLKELASELDSVSTDTSKNEAIGLHFGTGGFTFTLIENKYDNIHQYDSTQSALPESERDDGLMRLLLRTNVGLKSRYGSRSHVVVSESFQHSIPKLMFLFLPLFALYIAILHSRKKYYYTQHAIFSIHFHSFAFIMLMLAPLIKWILPDVAYLGEAVDLLTIAILIFYLTVALKINYQQPAWLAFVKAFAISVTYIITLIIGLILLAILIFFTA